MPGRSTVKRGWGRTILRALPCGLHIQPDRGSSDAVRPCARLPIGPVASESAPDVRKHRKSEEGFGSGRQSKKEVVMETGQARYAISRETDLSFEEAVEKGGDGGELYPG